MRGFAFAPAHGGPGVGSIGAAVTTIAGVVAVWLVADSRPPAPPAPAESRPGR